MELLQSCVLLVNIQLSMMVCVVHVLLVINAQLSECRNQYIVKVDIITTWNDKLIVKCVNQGEVVLIETAQKFAHLEHTALMVLWNAYLVNQGIIACPVHQYV